MAAFTSLALIGAGLLAGKLLGGKKKDQQAQTLAPSPTNANADAIKPPAPPVVNPGEQQAAAQRAGQVQRKRAATGSLLSSPKAPASNTMPVTPKLQPRSLLGS